MSVSRPQPLPLQRLSIIHKGPCWLPPTANGTVAMNKDLSEVLQQRRPVVERPNVCDYTTTFHVVDVC